MGAFFAFDGIDRAGKSTVLEHVYKRLSKRGIAVRRLHGGHICSARVPDLVGEYPDEIAYMLFWQAHRLLELTEIKPALDRGCVILCDRYILSNLAHNWWTDLDPDFQRRMEDDYIQRCLFPDVYFVFTVPYELFLKRDDGDTKMDRDLFERMQQDYITWSMRLSNDGFCKTILVEGSKPETAVSDFVMFHIRKEMGLEGD